MLLIHLLVCYCIISTVLVLLEKETKNCLVCYCAHLNKHKTNPKMLAVIVFKLSLILTLIHVCRKID